MSFRLVYNTKQHALNSKNLSAGMPINQLDFSIKKFAAWQVMIKATVS